MKKIIFITPFLFVLLFSFRIDYLGKLIRAEGAEALSYPDRVAIYLYNIPMAVGGLLIGCPEVALETLALMLPMDRNKTYVVDSDFALSSPRIKRIVDNYQPAMGRVPIGKVRYDDLRVTLAVGGGGLTCSKTECRIKVHVAYSENAAKVFWIDEAIFSGLQDLGWLNPYWLEYRFDRTL
jgi:hypothetical protein